MQLRTFLAKDMKEALATVRADMGPEAVIVASEKAKGGGVIVRAALDAPDVPEETQAPLSERVEVHDFDSLFHDGMLRRLRGPGDGKKRLPFSRGELLAAFGRHRLPEQLAHALAENAAKAQLTDMTLALAFAIEKSFKPHPLETLGAGAVLLLGPNGAGKTAVAAKIAAQARLDGRRTTLIASDASGAGAVARLETFAQHLDSAIAVAETAAELGALISACVAKKTFAIVDTAGFDPRDAKARTAFAALAQIGKVEAIGVVSALSDAEEAAEIADALASLGARRLIITQADLARRHGAVIAAATAGLPLAHITRSPFIAGGLERPTSLSLARLLLDEHRSAQ